MFSVFFSEKVKVPFRFSSVSRKFLSPSLLAFPFHHRLQDLPSHLLAKPMRMRDQVDWSDQSNSAK